MSYHKLSKAILVIAFLVIFTGVFAPSAKAVTIEELQAQIAALLAQIAQLQQQLAALQGGTAWCHTFNVNLRIGMSGTEVTALQTALQKEGLYGYPAIESTDKSGYFDEYTASAVVAFQEKYASEILAPWGLAHGTGYVATTTRAKLNALYGCGVVKPSITVLSPNGGETWVVGQTYDVTWKSSGVDKIQVDLFPEVAIEGESCKTSMNIANYISAYLGRYSFTVPSDMCTGSYYKVKISTALSTESGTTPIDLSDNCFSIVSSGTNLPPVIDGLTAPSQLKVNETGTWTIKAHDPENGVLSYSVDWGDTVKTPLSSSAVGTQTTTFTHSYSQIGTYTIAFTVTDDKYQTARTTTTVNVVSTTTPYIQVLSPNGGETLEVGKTYNIKWAASGIIADTIRLELTSTTFYRKKIADVSPSAGVYSWTITPDFYLSPNEKNRITVICYSCSPMFNDTSDNYFSIVEPTPTCTDSDGGRNYFLRGVINGICYDCSPTVVGGNSDHCVDSNNLREFYCTDSYGWIREVVNCPYGCSDGACKPGITVLSPNGGETWVMDQTYTISWKHNLAGSLEAQIDLLKGGIYYGAITNGRLLNAQNLTSYSWRVGEMKGGVGVGSDYQVKISYYDSNTGALQLTDSSDNYFTITSPTTTCTDSDGGINYFVEGAVQVGTASASDFCTGNVLNEYICSATAIGTAERISFTCPYGCENCACKRALEVFSPNGGETWTIGQNFNVTWQYFGVDKINVYLDKSGQPYAILGQNISASLRKYSNIVASILKTGNDYKIRITDTSNSAINDSSNNYFSITAGTTAISNMGNQLASAKEQLLKIAEELKKMLGM